jgi:hypothetical protein
MSLRSALAARLGRGWRRWRRSAMRPDERAAARAALRSARGAAGPSAEADRRRAHDACQNAPLWHAEVHALCLWDAVRGGRPPGLVALGQLAAAPIASLVRRASGLRPDEPGGPSLAATWAARRGDERSGSASAGRQGALRAGRAGRG